MGLRFLSVGSIVADAVSVAALAFGGAGTEGVISGLMVTGATVLPVACVLGGILLRRMEKPTVETVWQLAGFEANFLQR